MQNIPFSDLLTNAEVSDEETDELFSLLGCSEPPVDMVANIMHAVSQMPLPRPLSTWSAFDFLDLSFDDSQLC